MAFQGVTSQQGQVEKLMEINGAKLIGTKIKAPFGLAPEVYVLPMENVLSTKVRPDTCFFRLVLSLSVTFLLQGNRSCHFCPVRLTGRLPNASGSTQKARIL